MTLSTGTPLGARGMGEVYLARDTKLDRDVAIKVLPESLAHDKERVLRFEREAKLDLPTGDTPWQDAERSLLPLATGQWATAHRTTQTMASKRPVCITSNACRGTARRSILAQGRLSGWQT